MGLGDFAAQAIDFLVPLEKKPGPVGFAPVCGSNEVGSGRCGPLNLAGHTVACILAVDASLDFNAYVKEIGSAIVLIAHLIERTTSSTPSPNDFSEIVECADRIRTAVASIEDLANRSRFFHSDRGQFFDDFPKEVELRKVGVGLRDACRAICGVPSSVEISIDVLETQVAKLRAMGNRLSSLRQDVRGHLRFMEKRLRTDFFNDVENVNALNGRLLHAVQEIAEDSTLWMDMGE